MCSSQMLSHCHRALRPSTDHSLYIWMELSEHGISTNIVSSFWIFSVLGLFQQWIFPVSNCLNDILHHNCVGLWAASKCYLPTGSRRISRLNQNFKWSNKIFKFVFKLRVQSTQHLIDINLRSCKNW